MSTKKSTKIMKNFTKRPLDITAEEAAYRTAFQLPSCDMMIMNAFNRAIEESMDNNKRRAFVYDKHFPQHCQNNKKFVNKTIDKLLANKYSVSSKPTLSSEHEHAYKISW
jgi:hypothetical protein